MKVRVGFVSNSSTSSFVMLVRKDVHDEIVASMSKDEQKMIKAFFKAEIMKNTKALGMAVVEIGIFTDAGGGGTWDNFEEPDLDGDDKDADPDSEAVDNAYDLMEKYQGEAEKHKDACWSTDVGDGG